VVELISFQVTAIGVTKKPNLSALRPPTQPSHPEWRDVYFPGEGWVNTPILQRSGLEIGEHLSGPAVIQEAGSTTVLEPGDEMEVDRRGILLIEVRASN
jgi:N-methylhydantoinase A